MNFFPLRLYFSLVAAVLLAVAMLVALPGCQTPATFPVPAADWQTLTGQLHYRSATGRSVIGDVVVRRHGSDFQLAFSSGPGFPLLRLWQSGNNARAEGVLARGSWQGRSENAPAPLAGWLKLRERFARGSTPAALDVTEAGDRFAFRFSR